MQLSHARISLMLLATACAVPARAASNAQLSGKVGTYSAYFTDQDRVRHHRYELALTQKAGYTPSTRSVISGRFRYDAALDPRLGAYDDVSASVRHDELADGEVRQAYLDVLTDAFGIKAGRMLIDWVETLSPLVNDVLTPLDLRHGGFGEAGEIIVPVDAVSLNHPFFGGSFEWVVIPFGKSDRLPQGDNGYGLIPLLEEKLEGARYEVVGEKQPRDTKNVEAGWRYLAKLAALECSLLAFHGHSRPPAVGVEVVGDGELFRLHLTHPQQNTFGTALTYAGEAWVLRAAAFHEPNKKPGFFVADPRPPRVPKASRSRAGLGFDYVFSRHLKIYSEHFFTRTLSDYGGGRATAGADLDEKRDDYNGMLKLANESFGGVDLGLELLVAAPHRAQIVAPSASFDLPSDLKLIVGGRLIKSDDPKSPYDVLKAASHVYVSLFKLFGT